jgi:hypothetical protein
MDYVAEFLEQSDVTTKNRMKRAIESEAEDWLGLICSKHSLCAH